MPKRSVIDATAPPESFFVKELTGETPPSFAAVKRLYSLAADLFGFVPWQLLDESELIVTRDSVSGELWYCSVMGALGEVYSMHAYLAAVQQTGVVPAEVRVRSQRQKASLAVLTEHLGIKIRVTNRLPAAEQAGAHLLGFLEQMR